jgi:hypothetical protein
MRSRAVRFTSLFLALTVRFSSSAQERVGKGDSPTYKRLKTDAEIKAAVVGKSFDDLIASISFREDGTYTIIADGPLSASARYSVANGRLCLKSFRQNLKTYCEVLYRSKDGRVFSRRVGDPSGRLSEKRRNADIYGQKDATNGS